MASYNKIVLVGRLARDPEVKYTPQGTQLARFSLAVDRVRGKQSETDFFNIVAWQRLAEICGQYLKKGKLVLIDGELRSRKYETQDGQKRTSFEIHAQNMQMLGGKGESQGDYSGASQSRSRFSGGDSVSPGVEEIDVDELDVDEFDAEDMPF